MSYILEWREYHFHLGSNFISGTETIYFDVVKAASWKGLKLRIWLLLNRLVVSAADKPAHVVLL
jgi:hypothetical protein